MCQKAGLFQLRCASQDIASLQKLQIVYGPTMSQLLWPPPSLPVVLL